MLLFRLQLLLASFVILLSLAMAGGAQSRRVPPPSPTPTPQEDDAERVITEEVKLNVVAFDDNGEFVGNVKESDLVVTENNILHQPTSVRRLPANVLIVMDTGGEMRQVKSLEQTRKIARALLASLRPEDSVAVLQYGDAAEIVAEWTNDKSEISRAIGRTKFGRRSEFVYALNLATDFLLKNPLENKHLVLISDGTDSNGNDVRKSDAIRRLLSTEISVHVLSYARLEAEDIAPRTKGITNSPPPKAMPDEIAAQLPNGVRDVATAPKMKTINLDRTLLRKLKARKTDLENSERQLEGLAENTNGTMVIPDTLDEMVEKTALVAKMIDSSYVLTYIPKIPLAQTRGPAERNIVVTSKRAGLQVDARRKLIVNPNH
ncbi:MAG TPA: VWA domain-containing protein [Pyrinomonadaceae bacterium]|nr:VWA domain-containing protein [Pyrinomonadaceae bacterium]